MFLICNMNLLSNSNYHISDILKSLCIESLLRTLSLSDRCGQTKRKLRYLGHNTLGCVASSKPCCLSLNSSSGWAVWWV